MSPISPLAIGDAAGAGVALLLFVYEAWLFVQRPRGREHLFTAAICLGAATYCALMAVHYDAGQELALYLTRAEAVSLVLIAHAATGLCFSIPDRSPPKFVQPGLAVSFLVFVGLSVSPWLVPHVIAVDMSLLDHAFWRRPQTGLMTASQVFGFSLVLAGLLWLARFGRDVRREARFFGVGIGLWMVTALYGFGLSLTDRVPALSIAEYGFFGFAVALAARDARRFMRALQSSEREAVSARSAKGVAEALAAEVVSSVDEGFVVVGDDCAVKMWNPVMERITGIASEKALGGRLRELLGVTDELAQTIGRAVEGERGGIDSLELGTSNGPRRFAISTSPHRHEEKLLGAIVVFTDITEREQLVARMIELDRMAAVGTIAAGIGHEVNNPLAWMQLSLRALQRGLEGEEAQDESDRRTLLEDAIEGAARIQTIIDGLRAHAREPEELDTVKLSDVVRTALTLVSNDLRHRANVRVDFDGSVRVRASSGRLSQVFVSLLINAGHAVEARRGAGVVEVRVIPRGDHAVVEIEDNGTGMSEDVAARVFDPFYTTKPTGKGTGLGLSISRETVRELGGQIELETVENHGSIFRVILPRDQGEQVEPDGAPEMSSLRVPRPGTVLVVDDEPALVRALGRALRRHRWTVESAASVNEALAFLEDNPDVDIVLSDLAMPTRSGVELFEEAVERWPSLEPRFLFMTGGAITDEIRAFRAEHRGRVVDKPLDMPALQHRLQRMLRPVAADRLRETGDG